jgi:Fe-S-cluster-containing hydrogenase component 2
MKVMQKQLIIDLERCTGCRMCEMVCSLEKEGECSRSSSRIKVAKIDGALDVPVVCFQCVEPICQEKCPVKAIARDANGALIIDPKKCISCKTCVAVCPIGAVWFDAHRRRILKCDLCHGDPACVKFCQPQAISTFEKTEIRILRNKSQHRGNSGH